MKNLFILVLVNTLLTSCSLLKCNTHYGFVEGKDHMIGKKAAMNVAYYQKQASSQIMYQGKLIYTEEPIEKISFDGEGLLATGKYCDYSYLIDAETLKQIDWKYLKGSNPKACVAICGH